MENYEKKNSEPAPAYIFPPCQTTSSKPLGFGIAGGVVYSQNAHKWSFMNDVTDRKLSEFFKPLSPLVQLFPPTRPYVPKELHLLKWQKEEYIKESVSSLHSFYPDVEISDELLEQCLGEGLEYQDMIEQDDPYTGNLVAFGELAPKKDLSIKFITFPTGVLGNELSIAILDSYQNKCKNGFNIASYEFVPSGNPIAKFKTPIRQIECSPSETNIYSARDNLSTSSLIGVRTLTGTTLLYSRTTTPDDPEFDKTPVIATALDTLPNNDPQRHGNEQMHLTFNPSIFGEAVVTDDCGGIHLWRIERKKSDKCMIQSMPYTTLRESDPIFDSSSSLESNNERWWNTQYGAHPKALIVASRSSVNLFDLRASFSQQTSLTLFSAQQPADKIYAFQRTSAPHGFQSVVATTNKIVLLDHRFPNRALLNWEHFHIRDLPCGVEMINQNEESLIIAWSKNEPKLTAFHSSTCFSDSISSKCYPVQIPSIYSHPVYHRENYPRELMSKWHSRTEISYYKSATNPFRRLPPLMSVRALLQDASYKSNHDPNNAQNDNSNINENEIPFLKTGLCFTVFQLSYTGALFKSSHYLGPEASVAPEPYIENKEIIFAPISKDVETLQLQSANENLVGTNHEIMYKKHVRLPYDRVWEYIAREFETFPMYEPDINDSLKVGTVFTNWNHFEDFLEEYSKRFRFTYVIMNRVYNEKENLRSVLYRCNTRFCRWQVQVELSKVDERIKIVRLHDKHNTNLVFVHSYRKVSRNLEDRNGDDGAMSLEDFVQHERELVSEASHFVTLYELSKDYILNQTKITPQTQYIYHQLSVNIIPWFEGKNINKLYRECPNKTNTLNYASSVFLNNLSNLLVSNEGGCEFINCLQTFFEFPLLAQRSDKNWDWEKAKEALRRAYVGVMPEERNEEQEERSQNFSRALKCREFAIDDLMRDLKLSSRMLIPKNNKRQGEHGILSYEFISTNLKESIGSCESSYLFPESVNLDSNKEDSNSASKVKLSNLSQALLDNWTIGEDLSAYVYIDPDDRAASLRKSQQMATYRARPRYPESSTRERRYSGSEKTPAIDEMDMMTVGDMTVGDMTVGQSSIIENSTTTDSGNQRKKPLKRKIRMRGF
ncbi:5865_t:CDS:10 [Ambispora leptoticha]|uniref:5865_t:CDS:1 n=1 Tax=Ambispora leptoticha TaxID=144679 RepID=A0A9N8W319_9GLOM|nr:5865_t:CDS:10 [Ambispora leptoticha]